jgi:hypothetical protein
MIFYASRYEWEIAISQFNDKEVKRAKDAELKLSLLLQAQPELWDELKNDLARLGYSNPKSSPAN